MVGVGRLKALIIPEDPTHDQYVLKPVVEHLFEDLGQRARVEVLQNPRLRGVEQALVSESLAEIMSLYPMIDVFLLLVDRDAEPGRDARVARLEQQFGRLLACLAVEEVEVWMLALHRDRLGVPWANVRAEAHPKETFATPFLLAHAPRLGPGQGRKWAMREIGAAWSGLLRVCPELADLRRRLEARMTRS